MRRREFMQNVGRASLGAAFLSSFPWFSAFADEANTVNEVARIGVIGPGSRGQLLMRIMATNPKVKFVAICDDYKPNLEAGLALAGAGAKAYDDYRKMLEDKDVDGVIIATPPHLHCQMLLDTLAAGKHAFVEKAFSIHQEETHTMYKAYQNSDRVMFVGHQRMFDPRYIQIMERINSGEFGEIQSIRTNWDRNGNWRRPVPSPELERKINWRLYKDYSRGLMTELGSHQLQVGNWAMKAIPNKIMGHGAIVSRHDREVYDNVMTLYVYDNGVSMTFESTNSNKFYGLEERILCQKGTITPEKGKYYMESIPPAPGILHMINDVENKVFDAVPFAGTSWAPETANPNSGEYILGKKAKGDGTRQLLEAFAECVITGKRVPNLIEEGYYSSMLCLLGHQAMEEQRIIEFPDKYKIDYLNHKAPVA